AVEVAADALVLAVEDLLVELLEIEREVERPADPRVLELVAPRVQHEALHDAAVADREFLLDHALGFGRREIVADRPVLRAVLRAPVDLVGLERLEGDGGVAEIDVADLVEIAGAHAHRKVVAPVVLDALVDDRSPRLERLDAVGSAAERSLERGGAH